MLLKHAELFNHKSSDHDSKHQGCAHEEAARLISVSLLQYGRMAVVRNLIILALDMVLAHILLGAVDQNFCRVDA